MHVSLVHSRPRNIFKKLCSFVFYVSYSTAINNPISHNFLLLHSSPNARNLQLLHARLLRNGLYSNVILSSKLIIMYSKHKRLLPDSHSVFLHMPERNIYSWNIMIGEFSRSGFPERSIGLFSQMRSSGTDPDIFTLPLVLRACAGLGDLWQGNLAHGVAMKLGLEMNVFVASALVFLYVNLGKISEARKLFDQMPLRDAVLWTSMVGGYAQSGEPLMALVMFREMMGQEVELDGVVMVSLLLAFSQLGWLRHGKSVHGWSVRRCLWLNLSIGNALIDMYIKCGALHWAHKVFLFMPERDVISWSALILGYGINGHLVTALNLFDLMLEEGMVPNSVTFLGVLSACSHSGMVEKAWELFNMMTEYGVSPQLKHYACMVDVLGRVGNLTEAERFIDEMPMKPDAAIWGALLGGCRVHGDIEVAERVTKKLLELEPERSGYYALMANIYAAKGRFNDAERIWSLMRERNVNKIPGHSLIELTGS
ncbi:pentatricopeptide repeat-containing protein At4g14170 [Aristolochia californica]|uniref:pentatricopeptide repeat-containing protein At4g14170 n=1 Tax=Aristolochia californica TaxID=171875 RepID=UPI0035D5D9DE